MKHLIRRNVHSRDYSIALIGVGGTGAEVLRGLAKIALAARELHKLQVKVTVVDGDTVSRANLVRQPFTHGDLGRNKADCLVNRYNLWAGVAFESVPEMLTEQGFGLGWHSRFDLVVSCVDSAATRGLIHRLTKRWSPAYWLDCGNLAKSGQVILGQPLQEYSRDWHGRLPVVTELFPELLDGKAREANLPSCSLAEALERQDLLVNEAIAICAKQLVWRLVTSDELEWHGAFVDLDTGRISTLAVDPLAWKRFGHRGKRRPRRQQVSP